MALPIRLPRLQRTAALVVPLVAALEVCYSVRCWAGHTLASTTHDLAGGVGVVATRGLQLARRRLLLPWVLLLRAVTTLLSVPLG